MSDVGTMQRAIVALRQARLRVAELEAQVEAAHRSPVVLSGFERVNFFDPVDQLESIAALKRYIVAGRCAREHVSTDEGRVQVADEVNARVDQYAIVTDKIRQRRLSIVAALKSGEAPEFFAAAVARGELVMIDEKLDFYCESVEEVFGLLYDKVQSSPDDIIHATCTGYRSPSPAQRYFSGRGWTDATVTHSYHMGCYGAFPALRMAVGFLAASRAVLARPKQRIDVVHTELSSLHYDLTDLSAENIILMTLFSDGFVKYSATPRSGLAAGERGLEVHALLDQLVPESIGDMALEVRPDRFDVRVSIFVPQLIKARIRVFVEALCAQIGLDLETQKDRLVFAVHPGGPVILDHVRDSLGLREEQMRYSRGVLRDCGNMVSASVPTIWESIVSDRELAPGTTVITMAFGPGVTCTGAVLGLVEGDGQ